MKNFVAGILVFWRETWLTNKPLFWAEALGTVFGMAAALIMGVMSPNPNLLIIFTCYIISAILLMYSNYIRHSSWMVVLMTFYLITTTVGMFKLFI
jgi:hypothetical protein